MKHYFDVEIAKAVGVNAAIVYENLAFWIRHNAKQGKNLKDGVHWTYVTQKDLAAQFEYLSTKQVRTALDRLKDADLIRTGSFNRHGYDRTTWFALTDETDLHDGKTELPAGANGTPKRAIGFAVGGATIPDSKTVEKSDIDKERARKVAALCGAVCTV